MEKISSVLLSHACLYVSDVALHLRSESPWFFLVSFPCIQLPLVVLHNTNNTIFVLFNFVHC